MSNTKPPFRTLDDVDYVVYRGQVYRVARDDFNGETFYVEVDEIPDEYRERWG